MSLRTGLSWIVNVKKWSASWMHQLRRVDRKTVDERSNVKSFSGIKRAAKEMLQARIPTRHPAIVVASMGRSGSTLVYSAVCQGMARARGFEWLGRYGLRIVADSAWDPLCKKFYDGVVYKTHALSHELPASSSVKVIFVFGSASDAALSVISCRDRYGSEWINNHLRHLRATGPLEDIVNGDILRFEKQIDGWFSMRDVPVLAVHYEYLWAHEEVLSDFVGFPVKIPPKRSRQSRQTVPRDIIGRLENAYAALDEKIENLPVCKELSK